MKHIPYGYKIVDGKAVINEEEAEQVRGFFKEYIKGLSLISAAKKVGLNIYHGSAGRMLKNKYYLGTEFYPKIVDRETFQKAQELRSEKAHALGRVREFETSTRPNIPTKFLMKQGTEKYKSPMEKAEYLYSLIESRG